MKKCGWWKGHCLHKINGTERKVKRIKKKQCSKEDDYIYQSSWWGSCIVIIVQSKCCCCNKEQQMNLRDFDIMRAMNFPDYEDKK